MDKTPEINSSPENPKIPENWQFSERGTPSLKIDQIDLDERLLSFTLPDKHNRMEHQFYRGEYRDYFFDLEGKQLSRRLNGGYLTEIDLIRDNFVRYGVERGVRDGKKTVFIGFVDDEPASEISIVDFPIAALIVFRSEIYSERLGSIRFGREGNLIVVHLGDIFSKDSEGKHIKSPTPEVLAPNYPNPHRDWILYIRDQEINKDFLPPRKISGKDSTMGIHILNPKQEEEKVFEVEWKVQRGEDEATESREYLVVSQTHIPTGIIKTFRVPLSLDMQKIEDAVYSRPPYPKERVAGKDRLVVPWRNIDRIVDASLSYSYPPPKKS